MITVLSRLEVEIEIGALGIGGEKGGVLLSGHIEVFVDLSTLSKFQLQHLLFRRVTDAGDAAGVYRNSLHAFLDADEPREDWGGSFGFRAKGQRFVDLAESQRRLTIVMRPARLSETGGKVRAWAEPSMETSRPVISLKTRYIRLNYLF